MHSSKSFTKDIEKRAPDSGRFSHIYTIIGAVALAALLNFVFIVNAVVPSGSMEPTIPAGQVVVGWRLAYVNAEPQRGDVVIFRHEELGDVNILKRIVAVPGDIVALRDNGIWINDILYTYINGEFEEKTFVVPADSYFMVGDNTENSYDSRTWNDPFISRQQIIAKVIFGYFPDMYIID